MSQLIIINTYIVVTLLQWKKRDEESSEGDDVRTFRELRKMGNSIDRDIKMKEDVPSRNGDKKLPVLVIVNTWRCYHHISNCNTLHSHT